MRRSLNLLALCLIVLALSPATAQALPHGFFGIAPQTVIGKRDAARMRAGGVETIRAMLSSVVSSAIRAGNRRGP